MGSGSGQRRPICGQPAVSLFKLLCLISSSHHTNGVEFMNRDLRIAVE